MDLFNRMGIFNPKNKIETLKDDAYLHYCEFKRMDLSNENFYVYMKLINAEVKHLQTEYGHFPVWERDFIKHSDTYYDSMRFKVTDRKFKYDHLTFSNN